MDYEKHFWVQQRTKILEHYCATKSCPLAISSRIPREENPHCSTIMWYRRSEALAVWQTRPTVMHVWLPEHQHAFRTWGLGWNSHHESPPDGCPRKWGFPVLWREWPIATWNCSHTKCTCFRLKARPTRTKTINFVRVSANGSRTTSSLGRSSLQWRGTFPLEWAWGSGPQHRLISMGQHPWNFFCQWRGGTLLQELASGQNPLILWQSSRILVRSRTSQAI